MAKKAKTKVDPEAIEPVCPFTGEKLTLIRNAQTGMWQAQGPFYFTRFFNYKRELLHWLMHRDGVAPDFPGFPQITAEKTTQPPLVDPVADQVERARLSQEVADEYVEKNKKRLGLRK